LTRAGVGAFLIVRPFANFAKSPFEANVMDEARHPEPELIEPPRRRLKTHCRRGHELSEANVYRRPDGSRECRVCLREARRRHPVKHKPRGGPNGRPPHEPTPELRGLVELAASVGATQDQIARSIGIAWATLAKHYRAELARAKVAVDLEVAQTYREKMLGGGDWRKADVPALIWYTKARLGWSDKPEVFRFGQGHDFRDI
jgi:hypothetical protein